MPSDFTYTPDFAVEEQIEHKTIISEFESGVEQRRQKWSAPLRTFKLIFKNRTSTEYNDVKIFFNNKKGALTSFTWTNPIDNTEYMVRFKEDSLVAEEIAYGIFNFEFKFIQVK